MDLKTELHLLKKELKLIEEVDCSPSETEAYKKLLSQGESLPEGVHHANPDVSEEYARFYRLAEPDMPAESILEYVQCKQLHTLIIIKRCVVFFTILTVISLVVGALSTIFLLLA